MGVEQRRQHRIGVALEVRVSGKDKQGAPFREVTHSDNVSAGGCSFQLRREVEPGAVLEIEIYRHLPGPRGNTPFLTKGSAVRVTQTGPEQFTIGVRFTGPRFPTFQSETTTSMGF